LKTKFYEAVDPSVSPSVVGEHAELTTKWPNLSVPVIAATAAATASSVIDTHLTHASGRTDRPTYPSGSGSNEQPIASTILLYRAAAANKQLENIPRQFFTRVYGRRRQGQSGDRSYGGDKNQSGIGRYCSQLI
jgi:hypothetical protein